MQPHESEANLHRRSQLKIIIECLARRCECQLLQVLFLVQVATGESESESLQVFKSLSLELPSSTLGLWPLGIQVQQSFGVRALLMSLSRPASHSASQSACGALRLSLAPGLLLLAAGRILAAAAATDDGRDAVVDSAG